MVGTIGKDAPEFVLASARALGRDEAAEVHAGLAVQLRRPRGEVLYDQGLSYRHPTSSAAGGLRLARSQKERAVTTSSNRVRCAAASLSCHDDGEATPRLRPR